MGGLPSQYFHSLHELLNEKRMVLIPELFWNSCVKKPPRTSDNSVLSADDALLSQHMVMQRISESYTELI